VNTMEIPAIRPSRLETRIRQDFHIDPVRRMLCDSATWERFGKGTPVITALGEFLASIRFPDPSKAVH
jgi:hypothetical protein